MKIDNNLGRSDLNNKNAFLKSFQSKAFEFIELSIQTSRNLKNDDITCFKYYYYLNRMVFLPIKIHGQVLRD